MDSDVYLYFIGANIFSSTTITPPTTSALVAIVLVGILLFVSAFASASEIAFFSLSPTDLNKIESSESLSDKRITSLLADKEQLLTTVLITNNLVNVTIIMLCNYFFGTCIHFTSPIVEFIMLTIILTFVLLLFGEIMPKIFSAQKSLAFCRFAAPTITLLRSFFRPVSYAMIHSTTFINKYFAQKSQKYNISVNELSHALELTDKEEISVENNLLEGIIRFGGEAAKDIMIPRMDVVTLNVHATFSEVLTCIKENIYSRIPVYIDSLDNIKGILYIKDLLPHLTKNDNFRWQSLIRPAYFVPETKMIDELLREFQANRVHIAIVVDEFGGTSGIVTMEDVIEEIVGEIHDEYDDDENNFIEINDHTWIFEAKTLLTDFYKETNLEEDFFQEVEGDADTIAGLLLELKGEFPALHEKVIYRNYEFEVLAVDSRRIKKVKFTIKETNSEANKRKETSEEEK
ncbi:MAG: gliding motility-associated protein GldE [Bacteroidales bacterium]|nr:gliding motility-associated protein GldE [Bacteroidales bacterium]